MSVQTETRRIRVTDLKHMKDQKRRIACLTAYDASFAALLESCGVDVVLVGDSLGMVIQGHETTLPVTMDDIVYHTRCVCRGLRRTLVMADLPFMSDADPDMALLNAARLLQEGGAQMVKLETEARQASVVERLATQGIPVCAHLGLRPQTVHKMGGYRMQGVDEHSAERMVEDAYLLSQAGADMLLLECVPPLLAAEITANMDIPVIGIGAGPDCDGQILVLQDVLGVTPGRVPSFARNFMQGADSIQAAVSSYIGAVRSGTFPASA